MHPEFELRKSAHILPSHIKKGPHDYLKEKQKRCFPLPLSFNQIK